MSEDKIRDKEDGNNKSNTEGEFDLPPHQSLTRLIFGVEVNTPLSVAKEEIWKRPAPAPIFEKFSTSGKNSSARMRRN